MSTSIQLGDKYGDWEVIDFANPRYIGNGGNTKSLVKYWLCKCSCGYCNNTTREVIGKNLRKGKSNGCGKKHRMENGKKNKKVNEYLNINGEFYCVTSKGNILIDEESIDKIKGYFWNIHFDTNNGYARAYHCTSSDNKKKFIFMHNLLLNNFNKELVVDHKDGNTLNNKLSNLRLCKQHDNMKNLKIYSSNKSGYKGVYYSKQSGKWKACINFNKQKIHLGTFIDKQDAIKSRKEAERKYFGEYNREEAIYVS
ncbi:MAG: HNH endonuclease [Clostridium sp.]|uniref:HNH endonuclease n=1 Tax=Clostridium sp. TaxID=1506 RepID=UPI003F36B030